MKNTFKISLFLGIIACFAAILISYVNDITAPIISENAIASEKENLLLLYPEGEFEQMVYSGEDTNILGIYKVKNHGYIIKAQAVGYNKSVPIVALIAFENDETVGLKILEQQETSGFGSHCFEEDFIRKTYLNKKAEQQIDIYTGATYTSEAMQSILASSFNALKEIEG